MYTLGREECTITSMKTMQATMLRQNLAETLEGVAQRREPVAIYKHGRSVAVLVPSPELPPGKKKPVIDLDAISSFCRRHDVRKFSLFGSILRDDFDEESDVDVLVDLGGRHIDVHVMFRMIDELEVMFGRKVDMIEESNLPQVNPRRRSAITTTARVIHEAS